MARDEGRERTAEELVAELRESEERFRTICENAPVMIDSFAADGTVLLWNRECERQLGYTHEEIAAHPDPLALTYPNPGERERVLQQILRADGRFREYTVRAKDGSDRIQIWADFRLPTGTLISVGHDLTAQRRVESQLRQSQKMEALGQLTGGIAHDFNNLLTVILANASIIEERLAVEETDALTSVRETQAAARRGMGLIRKLLAFSRGGSLSFTRADPNRLLAEITPTLRRLVPESIDLQLATDPSIPEISIDAGALDQMLMNLITNARDAMPSGGELRIVTSRRWLDVDQLPDEDGYKPGEYVVVAVTDTGVGMDDETRQRVFDPFFTTKEPGAGTGLGMPMIYGLMQQHDGVVDVQTARGTGTTVRLLFPVASEHEGLAPRRGAPAAPTSERPKILVVEDEPAIRRVMQLGLGAAGFDVIEAPNGEEALRILETKRKEIALVISDVVMPRMSGPELVSATASSGLQGPKFLLTSGHSPAGVMANVALDASIPMLPKPWTPEELISTVRALLEGAPTPAAS